MLKKTIILLLIFLGLAGLGYYVLEKQGVFQTKEDIYTNTGSEAGAMKCEAGKCAAGKCASGK